MPLRHVPPTAENKIAARDIDTGPLSPQAEFKAWKSPGWKDFANVFPFATGAFFVFVGLVIIKNPQDARMAPVMFLTAAVLFLSFFPLRMLCKGKCRVGIDPKTNTLWFARGEKVVAFEVHAGNIEGLSYASRETVRLNTLWHINPSMPLFWRKKEWLLTVKRKSSEFVFEIAGSGLATEKEAARAAQEANRLLGFPD